MIRRESGEAPAYVESRVAPDGTPVVALRGAFDAAACETLEHSLAGAVARRPERLLVDLSGATMVDSVTLATLVYAAKRLSEGGGTLVFSGARPTVHRTFELTGLARVLGVGRAV